jgi:hypothetical protein
MIDDDSGFLSTLYHALRTHRRRRVIRLVQDAGSTVLSVQTLAREIAAAEHGVAHQHATGEPYRNVYNALSQTHLPALADARVIIYDSDRQTVSAGPNLPLAAFLLVMNRSAIETLIEVESIDRDDPP